MESSQFAIILILCAALLHALWNALIKGSADRALTLGLINIGHGITGGIMLFFVLPPASESWPFIVASTIIHFFYYAFLLAAYRVGDLSQVYPIARGVAPVLVALGAQFFAGEVLPPIAWAGILLVSMGIFLIFLARHPERANRGAVIAALFTGFSIAAYSVTDGLGVRAAAHPLGYIAWLFFLEWFSGIFFLVYRRQILRELDLRFYLVGLAGGIISALAYGLAIYAKNLTTLGTVSAIRESSVIIAALIGVIWFKERPWKVRIAAALVVAAGVILLASAA